MPDLSHFHVVLAFVICVTASISLAEPARTLEHFESGGKRIRVETFSIANAEAVPSIIVLHGATGVEFANRFIAVLAKDIAAQGFTVHLVHYFDRTGTHFAGDDVIRRSSSTWLETIHDAVQYFRRTRPQARIGVFGYSLGGYLAAAESVSNTGVAAAVVLAGGFDEASVKTIRHAPPMLILHGASDTRVPVTEARKLANTLEKAGGTPEVHIYEGEGHIMSSRAYGDAIRRAVKFFREKLERN